MKNGIYEDADTCLPWVGPAVCATTDPRTHVSRFIRALFASALVALTGCSLFPPTLEEQGIVRIQTQGTDRIHFQSVSAYAENEGFELRGMVVKHRLGGGGIVLIPGHIDVLMRTADGREQKKLGVQLVPRARPRHTSRKAYFVVRFDALPTRGSVLVVTYHEGSHPLSQLGSVASASGPLSLVLRQDGEDISRL